MSRCNRFYVPPSGKRGIYPATKAFETTFTELLNLDLVGTGVRVQALIPGLVSTPFHERTNRDISQIPPSWFMTPHAVVEGSLAGLGLGEVICMPSFSDFAPLMELQDVRKRIWEGTVLRHGTMGCRRIKETRMQWVTREKVRVGRIACSWLIKRFVDPEGDIRYLSNGGVAEAVEEGAIAFHVRGAEFNHRDRKTPFELMVEKYELGGDPAMELLGRIVNGADTDNSLYNQPEGPGVRAVTEGIRKLGLGSDEAVVAQGSAVFDALYAYCTEKTAATPR